jgi:hypothetical protein
MQRNVLMQNLRTTKFYARRNKKRKAFYWVGSWVWIQNTHTHPYSHIDLSSFSHCMSFFIFKFCKSMYLYIIYPLYFWLIFLYVFDIFLKWEYG